MSSSPLTSPEFWEKNYTTRKRCPSMLSRADVEVARAMHPYLLARTGGKLLEMGCGGSYWLPYFVDKYRFSVHGVDFSGYRLAQTRLNLSLRGLGGRLVCDDILDAPLPKDFDVVCSFGVAEHFGEPSQVIRRFADLLKLGGVIITTVPYMAGLWGRLQRAISPDISNGYVEMDLAGLVRAHTILGVAVVQAQYLRWLDIGVLNLVPLAWPLRWTLSGVALAVNAVPVALPWLTRIHMPEVFYSDMIVIGRKV